MFITTASHNNSVFTPTLNISKSYGCSVQIKNPMMMLNKNLLNIPMPNMFLVFVAIEFLSKETKKQTKKPAALCCQCIMGCIIL